MTSIALIHSFDVSSRIGHVPQSQIVWVVQATLLSRVNELTKICS